MRTYFGFGLLDQLGDVLVREASLLGGHDEVLVDGLERGLLELLVHLDNVLELVQEPLVNLGEVVQLVNSVTEVEHGVGDGEESAVVVLSQGSSHVLGFPVGVEAREIGVDLTNSLLEGLLESSADGHDFADRLHGRTDVTLNMLELGQIPLGDLGDNVIERRLEAGGGRLGNSVGQFGESVTKSDLGSGVRKRVTSGLGGEGTGMI
jgi:hypothetical protein